MSGLPNLIYRFNVLLIKITVYYFIYINKMFLKFILRIMRPRITNTILNKNKIGGLMISDFKTYL